MATFYISPSGNDVTGSGSLANPWRSLFKATSTVGSGNVIWVKAGTYLETQQCNLGIGVSIDGDGDTAIIQSTLTAQYTPIIVLHSSEGTNGNQFVRNIKIDGRSLATSWGLSVAGRSNVEIYNITVIDFMETGVNVKARGDGNPQAPTIYSTGNSFHDSTIINCAFADSQFGRGCFQFGGQDGMLIYNNTIINKTRSIGAGGWPIKNYNDGFTKNCKIYDNYLERGPYPYSTNGNNNYWNFAIELFNVSGIEIFNNRCLGSIDTNFQVKGSYAYGAYIHDNIIGFASLSSGYESGIIMEFGSDTVIVENNTIMNTANPVYFTPRTGNTIRDIRIQKNLLTGVGIVGGGAGFGIAQQTPEDGTVTTTNFYVYNNTIIAAAGGNASNYGIRIPDGGPSTNVRIVNNIIQGFLVRNIVTNPAGVVQSLYIYNNRYYQNGNADVEGFNGTPVFYDHSGNTIGDPGFVGDPTYQLSSPGSPCINTGIDVGLPFSGPAPDIGYFETPGAGTPPIANAGIDQLILIPISTAVLSGGGTDVGGSIVSYTWSQAAGPSVTVLATPNSTTCAVSGLSLAGIYIFRLTIVDNDGNSAYDEMNIRVSVPSNSPISISPRVELV